MGCEYHYNLLVLQLERNRYSFTWSHLVSTRIVDIGGTLDLTSRHISTSENKHDGNIFLEK